MKSEEQKLVDFFRSAEGDALGRAGDHDNLTPAETAIRAIRMRFAWERPAEVWKKWACEVRANNARNMGISQENSLELEVFYWLALAGEVGEGANLVKKAWRDGMRLTAVQANENRRAVREELADVRIYVEALAALYGMDLDAACKAKMRKVMLRPFAQPACQSPEFGESVFNYPKPK